MKKPEKVRVGISVGDLNGIGSEIILKTFEDPRMLEFCTPVVFANTKILSFFKKHYKMNSLSFQGVDDASKAIDGKFNVVNVWKENPRINFGKEDRSLAKYTIKSLATATEALLENKINTLVTAPINKNVVQSEEFKFPGHTDYLAQQMKGDSLMLMLCKNLRIGLLTDHVAVKEVAEKITPELIQKKVSIIYDTLKKDFRVQKPKIAILGINPHSGDNGVIGKEDEEILKPTIQKINDKGTLVYGPYSADSFFGTKNYKNFDAIIAAYHDQGLIPFKTLSFGRGVNFTAGLSGIRTSPDHGTAYEIAGKGEADFTSFKEAVFASIEIYKCRKEYLKLTKNPLQKQSKKL